MSVIVTSYKFHILTHISVCLPGHYYLLISKNYLKWSKFVSRADSFLFTVSCLPDGFQCYEANHCSIICFWLKIQPRSLLTFLFLSPWSVWHLLHILIECAGQTPHLTPLPCLPAIFCSDFSSHRIQITAELLLADAAPPYPTASVFSSLRSFSASLSDNQDSWLSYHHCRISEMMKMFLRIDELYAMASALGSRTLETCIVRLQL